MEEIGPVDYAVIAFPGNQFKGEIAPALADLTDDGTIRIIDVAFVGKSAGGDTVAMELTELDPEVQASLDKLGIEGGGLVVFERIPHEIVQAAREWALEQANA